MHDDEEFTNLLTAKSADAAKQSIRSIFFSTQRRHRAPFLAPRLRDVLRSCENQFSTPLIFAYAARAALDGPHLYIERERGKSVPTAQLTDFLDDLLEEPAASENKTNYYYPIISGIREYIHVNENISRAKKAYAHFHSASLFPDFFNFVKDDLGGGASFARPFPNSEILAKSRGRIACRELQFHQDDVSSDADLVLSIFADQVYAEAFFPRWVQQLGEMPGINVGLHLHIMFRTDMNLESLKTFEGIAARLAVNLSLTYEISPARDRAYFASRRFMLAGALLGHFKKPMCLIDADTGIVNTQDFSKRFLPLAREEKKIVGLMTDLPWDGYMPWRHFSATWLFLPNEDYALSFMNTCGDTIEYFFDQRKNRNWWIDQFSLQTSYLLERIKSQGACESSFSSWHNVFGDVFHSIGEEKKISAVSATREVKELLSDGLSYWQAVNRLANSG